MRETDELAIIRPGKSSKGSKAKKLANCNLQV
jgi:hypothetical protein